METRNNKRFLDMNSKNYDSFIDIKIPSGVYTVNFSHNRFVDFTGLEFVDGIENFIADHNPIISFKGFPYIQKNDGTKSSLRSLSLINTPLSQLPNFRALALIVCGDQLTNINGQVVTSNDRASAAALGDPIILFTEITRGWLPSKNIYIPTGQGKLTKSTLEYIKLKKDGKIMKKQWSQEERTLFNENVNKIIERQENDPFTVKFVRLMRKCGSNRQEMKQFIHNYFSPNPEISKQIDHEDNTKKTKRQKTINNEIEQQIEQQQQIINVMAAQLQALRSGNNTFNAYYDLVSANAAPLFENAHILEQMNNGGHGTVLSNLNKPKFQKSSNSSGKDYEGLRNAVMEFFNIDPETKIGDAHLIKRIEDYLNPEEEEELHSEEDNQKSYYEEEEDVEEEDIFDENDNDSLIHDTNNEEEEIREKKSVDQNPSIKDFKSTNKNVLDSNFEEEDFLSQIDDEIQSKKQSKITEEEQIIEEELSNEELKSEEELLNEKLKSEEELLNEELKSEEELSNEELKSEEELLNEELKSEEEILNEELKTEEEQI